MNLSLEADRGILRPLTQIDGRKSRVLVAMSGGVDSSVAAALLVEQGFDVVGVTMQVWDYSACSIEEGQGTCCSSVDVDDARSVADRFGFPFYVANCEAKFKAAVIDPFLDSYKKGETPLPCVNCNTFLKFDHLVKKMNELNCDYLATGHYAKIRKNLIGNECIETSDDRLKDQTYFLFTMDPQLLPKLMFPIGHLNKAKVREEAERLGLLNAKKKDSVGICFVGSRGYADFFKENVSSKEFIPGKIKHIQTGEVLADHEGIHLFTYGQRKGLQVVTKSSSEAPMYVVKIDSKTGDVWVGPEEFLLSQSAQIRGLHFLSEVQPGEKLRVKIRYAHAGVDAHLHLQDAETAKLEFVTPVRSITPGQAAVFYRDRELVGGGWFI